MSWHSGDPAGAGGDRLVDAWHDDDRLGAALADAVRDAQLADRVVAAARAAFAAHRRAAEDRDELAVELFLLTLVHDSDLAGSGGAHVRDRSGRTPRTLVFEGDGVGVEVELHDGEVEGQLVPAHAGSVTVRSPDGVVTSVDTDEVGWFHLDARPHGPVRLVCTSDAGTCMTEWLSW